MLKNILAITGEPRSGTSLMMQTLELLGIPCEKQRVFASDQKRVSERADYLNPKGFYEVPGVVVRGVRNGAERFYGKALKLVATGMVRTNPEHIEKVIVCTRDPREVADSQTMLSSNISVAQDGGWGFSPQFQMPLAARYIIEMGYLCAWLHQHMDTEDILCVDFADMHENPRAEIDRLCKFLGVPLVESAVHNVDRELYRSKPVDLGDGAEIAMKIYEMVKNKVITGVRPLLADFIRRTALERVSWMDDEEHGTWVLIGPSLFRALETNHRGVKDQLLATLALRAIMMPNICKHYSRTGASYTVKRPKDIGDLTRSMVFCDNTHEDTTVEDCFRCWNENDE